MSANTSTVSWRPRAGDIPTQPGVYRFRDASSRVLYVGKAKNLRARLKQYFTRGDEREMVPYLIPQIEAIDTMVALTEKESALLHALASAGTTGAQREVLLSDIWGMSADADTHTLETHVYRLRAKLGGLSPVPAELANEGGMYRMVVA